MKGLKTHNSEWYLKTAGELRRRFIFWYNELMQKIIHRAQDRGRGEYGWLHTRYSFSFAEWYEPSRMGFGKLRVLNDDIVEANNGFGNHPHDNMEIITIVTEGEVSHKDSMGNTYTVPAGDVQVMSAGTGVVHSEYNNSPDKRLALFQIWIEPKERNIKPRYAQKSFGLGSTRNTLELLAGPTETAGALFINQDAYVLSGHFDAGKTFEYELHSSKNGAYIFVADGLVSVAGEDLGTRDAIGISEELRLSVSCKEASRVFIFEVPL
jgi:redox-sensitive bicupin YhaK (pirin superfamily)